MVFLISLSSVLGDGHVLAQTPVLNFHKEDSVTLCLLTVLSCLLLECLLLGLSCLIIFFSLSKTSNCKDHLILGLQLFPLQSSIPKKISSFSPQLHSQTSADWLQETPNALCWLILFLSTVATKSTYFISFLLANQPENFTNCSLSSDTQSVPSSLLGPLQNLSWMSSPLLSSTLTLTSSQLGNWAQHLQTHLQAQVLHLSTSTLLPDLSSWRTQVLALLCSEQLNGSILPTQNGTQGPHQLTFPDPFSLVTLHSLSNTLHFNQIYNVFPKQSSISQTPLLHEISSLPSTKIWNGKQTLFLNVPNASWLM